MEKIKHKAKKSLGQNFLKSVSALNKIIEAGEISDQDIILEIGPGKGALTEKILEKVYPFGTGLVIAVEKDRDLFALLSEKFSKEILAKKLILLESDILDFDIAKIIKNKKYKIIANIPYNITGAILKKFLTEKNQPELMVLMVQNEVAQRVIARDKKESILSISVKAYGEPKIITKVPARYFSPAPKVDSAVLLIKNISRNFFEENKISEKNFWEVIHAGFAHKRKKLSNNLKNIIPKEKNLYLNNRAEELPLDDWLKLTKN
ncbi:MAG TPA: 16S rRNA (adenine(1518)-N(6)/adenine(1519)-N(6))-dimethyltransferase RsmA [Candidatus Paceibacterota bacterium]|nr:16S rRNA (adenine(1518)-N(6)/adenine(1519)-N(6))-dimethyltransferase RsmA [Candidatus Paceibacterota bacterium]